jgi:hypothetical protein
MMLFTRVVMMAWRICFIVVIVVLDVANVIGFDVAED